MFEESTRLKVLLIVLIVVALAALVFVTWGQKNLQSNGAAAPETTSAPTQTKAAVTPSDVPMAPASAPLTSDDKTKLSDLQKQINAGTISSEEAIKQINAINARLQAEAKK